MMAEKFVLVVDDNPETLQFLSFALADAGLSVKTAKSVLGAVELLHGSESMIPDLIITDLIMPQTTGWDLLAHLRDDALLRHVPVMVVTGASAIASDTSIPPGCLGTLTSISPGRPLTSAGRCQRWVAASGPAPIWTPGPASSKPEST